MVPYPKCQFIHGEGYYPLSGPAVPRFDSLSLAHKKVDIAWGPLKTICNVQNTPSASQIV